VSNPKKEIVLPANKYFQAEKDTRITARANKEYKDKLKVLARRFNISEGVLLSYMIDYFWSELNEQS
jgi:hypothetical protein